MGLFGDTREGGKLGKLFKIENLPGFLRFRPIFPHVSSSLVTGDSSKGRSEMARFFLRVFFLGCESREVPYQTNIVKNSFIMPVTHKPWRGAFSLLFSLTPAATASR